MNESLSSREFYSSNRINLMEEYEACRRQSPCYLLLPPPKPPSLPELIPNDSFSKFTKQRQHTYSFYIISGIFITLVSTVILAILLGAICHLYRKLQERQRRIKQNNIVIESASVSSIVPTSYSSLTSLAVTTNQSPSLVLTSALNQNHSTNIYEQIPLSSDARICTCCLCVQAYYQQQFNSKRHELTPYYYTYDSSPAKVACRNCLFVETLHRNQNCFCHNFFVPIK